MALKKMDDGKRLGQLVALRMTPGEISLVDQVAAEFNVSRSEAIRMAVRGATVKRVAVVEFTKPNGTTAYTEYAG